MTGTAEAQPSGFSGAHAALSGLAADDHLQYALLAGRALGQVLQGGTGAGETLELRGSAHADTGRVTMRSGADSGFNWVTDSGAYMLHWGVTIPATGAIVTAGIDIANVLGVNAGTFILSALDDHSTLTWSVSPGFAVGTLFFARQQLRSISPGIAPSQQFIFAAQSNMDIQGAGSVTTSNYRGLSFVPALRARNASDVMTLTNCNAVTVAPVWNTNNNLATVDFGTVRGIHMTQPAQIFLGQSLGTERCANYIGLDYNSITFTTTGIRAVIRSALLAVLNKNFFLLNLGGAESQFGTGGAHWNDNTPIQFGGTAYQAQDASIFWSSGGWLEFFFAANGDSLELSNPNNNQFVIAGDTVNSQINLNFERGFTLGSGVGTLGNQFGNFVTPARTVGVAGGWADFLLTQAGNLSIGAFAMSDVSAWVINSISLAGGTGSIADLSTLVVGAMTTSNPGITVTRRSALRVTGRAQLSGSMAYPPIVPAALASGNTNNWIGLVTNVASNATRHWARISGNVVTSVITGIDATAVQDGDSFELTNVSANAIDITHQDAASAAANRIISPTGATYTIAADETVLIRYDLTTARWRLLAGTGT